jgi:plastocyanin
MPHQSAPPIHQKARPFVLFVAAFLISLLVLAACTSFAVPPPPVAQGSAAPAAEAMAEDVAPDVDRIGFPEGYQENMQVYYEFDRPDNRSARVIYANAIAAGVGPGEMFPYGSELVMKVYRTVRDGSGNVVLDENGRFTRDALFGLFLMRKEAGFGSKYGELRNGEWEYVAYRPDGSFVVPPDRTNACAACHVEAGHGKDFVFGAHRSANAEMAMGEPAENTVVINDYSFSPEVLTVKVGTEVTFDNQDVVFHNVLAQDQSFNSGLLRLQASRTHTFEEEGTYKYFCPLHSNMKGTVVVVE